MKLLVSSSIVPFREKAEKIWKLERYQWPRDIFKPVVFMGCYHVGDYYHYLRHLGPKIVWWAGSDVTNLITSKIPWYKIFRGARHYTENWVEKAELDQFNIKAEAIPSFLEDVNDFPISFVSPEKKGLTEIYLSCHVGREEEYGVKLIERIAPFTPGVHYHIYGSKFNRGITKRITYHGRVPSDQFNKEIKEYHCGLRPNEHDGFSEITAKSILMGQYPISKIKYPHVASYETEAQLISMINSICTMCEPNYKAREYYLKVLNKYPWCSNQK